jgi:hypothetical protein
VHVRSTPVPMNLPQIRFPRIQQRTVANHSVSTYRTHFPTTWPIPPTQLLSPCDTCSHHLSCGPICGSRYVHTAGFFHAPHKKCYTCISYFAAFAKFCFHCTTSVLAPYTGPSGLYANKVEERHIHSKEALQPIRNCLYLSDPSLLP